MRLRTGIECCAITEVEGSDGFCGKPTSTFIEAMITVKLL